MHRRNAILAGGVLLSSLAALPARAAATPLKLVQSTNGIPFLPALAAKELGLFAARGIDAEFIVNLGGAEALAATVSGGAQINVGAAATVMKARQRGVGVKVFGTSYARYASNIVVSSKLAKARGITPASTLAQRVEALKGARIAVLGVGSGSHQLLLYLLKNHQINAATDLEIQGIGAIGSIMAGFAQGRLDGFVAASPSGEEAVRNHGGYMLINTSAGAVPELFVYPHVIFAAREDWLAANRATASGFMDAVGQALEAMHHKDSGPKVRDLLHAKYHAQMDKSLFNDVWASNLNAWPRTPAITRDMAQRALKFLNDATSDTYETPLLDSAFDYSLSR